MHSGACAIIALMLRIVLLSFLVVSLSGLLAFGYFFLDAKTIRGYARDAETNAPLARATIQLAQQTTRTDELGAFTLQTARGEYALRVSADGYQASDTVIDGRDLFESEFFVDIALEPAGVRVQIVAADNGQPLVGARVQTDSQQLVTDAAGAAMLARIPNGARVRVSADGYASAEFSFDAQATYLVKLAPAVISLVALDQATQQPLSYAVVNANGQTVTTDADGRANLRSLPFGARVRVTANEHDAVELVYNGEGAITARLHSNILRGTLRDAPTQKPLTATLWLNDVMTRADEQGNFSFANVSLPSVAATLTIKAVGYRLARLPLTSQDRDLRQTVPLNLALEPFQVRGIHIYYGMPRAQVLALLDRLQGTQANALVIDVKSDRGEIVWQSNVPLAKQINASATRGIDLRELIQQCRARNLYCLARTVVMKDDKLAYARPDLALHTLGGAVYADTTAAWLNPAKKEVHAYALALGKELVGIGFDEVQFDYIRYPGNFGIAESGNPDTRVAAIKSFLANAQQTFATLPAFLSADVFGLTTLTDDENNIGQRLREFAPYLDSISPMEYPDTYNAGMLQAMGIEDCAVPRYCPYETVFHSTRGALDRAGTTRVRPWIQAYGWSTADYLQEKKAANDAGSYGWIFWNNEGLYDERLFK